MTHTLAAPRRSARAGPAADGPLASRPPWARVGTVAVYAAALATYAAVAALRSPWPTQQVWLFAGLAVAGAAAIMDVVPWWQPESRRRDDATLSDTGAFFDIADLFFVVGALLLGPLGAVLVSLPAFVVRHVHSRPRLYKTMYNASSYVIGGALTWATFHGLLRVLEARPSAVGELRWIVAALAAALVFEGVNLAACTFARWTMHGLSTPVRDLLRLYPVWTETGACVLAVILTVLWQAGPWLVTLGVFPVLILRQGLYLHDLQIASRTDAKTGLYNIVHFTEIAEREVRRALRQDGPLTLLVADLDHLRRINTAHGHLAGDVVLKGIAAVLRDDVREFDVVCRFGGEEFVILLPGTGLDEALGTAERLRAAVEHAVFDAPTAAVPLRVTISIGVACLRAHGLAVEDLMHAADLALYRAKADGRNAVRVADGPEPSIPAQPAPATP